MFETKVLFLDMSRSEDEKQGNYHCNEREGMKKLVLINRVI